MKNFPSRFGPGRGRAAFSLVEIALALGIVGFALVGIVGALPVAMNNERLSVAQTRAASLANTVFANFRAQPFDIVQYADGGVGESAPTVVGTTGTINLNAMKTTADAVNGGALPTGDLIHDPLVIYAAFDETIPSTPSPDARRLHFSDKPPAGVGLYYQIVLRFDNNPTGTLPPYTATPGAATAHAQANAIEASITESNRPKDVFHFNSVVANRSE